MSKTTDQQQAAVLLQAISTAYQDPQVQGDPDLSALLVKNSKRLSNGGDYHKAAADLNQGLRYWGMAHLYGPKALNALYQATIDGTRGRAYQRQPTGFDN
ncbi:bacteriocin immunity protein [Lactiplantibacillus garii]|uniref:Bacteriocin immunity protein n=1 Tax=Lactiplantibacillus garii TaxID=2306423 RepID=A0A426D7J3_9LACO|nr:bacteriocin immunity protein [Lactiplantibacillus garii]RRK10556.1 bacteriocin immunity protein [Lactiplantibacillus garii]